MGYDFKSVGLLVYGPSIQLKVVVDREISNYYRNLIPKYKNVIRQGYLPHISVVRLDIEIPPNMNPWGKYNEEQVEFKYGEGIGFREPFYSLSVQSERIGQIRKELGLPEYRGNEKDYHITIGRMRE